MPQTLDDCVRALIAHGKTKDEAWAICQAQQNDKNKKKPKKPKRK